MKSTKLRLAIAMTLLSAPLAGCVRTAISNDVPDCARLIPNSWREGVPAADLPETLKLADGHDDAKPWQKGFTAQTVQLETANDRTIGTDHIYAECLAMHRARLQQSKGFFSRLFGG